MDGNHFKAKKMQVLPAHILTRISEKTPSIWGGREGTGTGRGTDTGKGTFILQHLPILVTFFHKTGQTKMKKKMEPDEKEIWNFQAESSESWRLRLKQ